MKTEMEMKKLDIYSRIFLGLAISLVIRHYLGVK